MTEPVVPIVEETLSEQIPDVTPVEDILPEFTPDESALPPADPDQPAA
jgi:hypothetical protein